MPGMAVALSVFGVAFAAFCVWLAVRMVNRGRKPGRAFWAAALVVGLMLYVASIGPAYRAMCEGRISMEVYRFVYRPVWLCPQSLHDTIKLYCIWCLDK
jgi:hypothetical protein